MSRLATALVATAIASGSGLIGLAAGGMANMGREARAMQRPALEQVCPRPHQRPLDPRQL